MGKGKVIALGGMLVALALALSYGERFLGLQLLIPLPGAKLGLANVVTLTALYLLGWRTAFTILILRCFLGSMFGGGVTGLLFSLTGGFLAMCIMAVAKQQKGLSFFGVSVLGAAMHNTGQVFMAVMLMGTNTIFTYLPYLLLLSIPTGLINGYICSKICSVLQLKSN